MDFGNSLPSQSVFVNAPVTSSMLMAVDSPPLDATTMGGGGPGASGRDDFGRRSIRSTDGGGSSAVPFSPTANAGAPWGLKQRPSQQSPAHANQQQYSVQLDVNMSPEDKVFYRN